MPPVEMALDLFNILSESDTNLRQPVGLEDQLLQARSIDSEVGQSMLQLLQVCHRSSFISLPQLLASISSRLSLGTHVLCTLKCYVCAGSRLVEQGVHLCMSAQHLSARSRCCHADLLSCAIQHQLWQVTHRMDTNKAFAEHFEATGMRQLHRPCCYEAVRAHPLRGTAPDSTRQHQCQHVTKANPAVK